MSKYSKSDDTEDFEDLESPHRDKSFEERTGEKFQWEVNYEIIPEGNGYGKLRPKNDDD